MSNHWSPNFGQVAHEQDPQVYHDFCIFLPWSDDHLCWCGIPNPPMSPKPSPYELPSAVIKHGWKIHLYPTSKGLSHFCSPFLMVFPIFPRGIFQAIAIFENHRRGVGGLLPSSLPLRQAALQDHRSKPELHAAPTWFRHGSHDFFFLMI